MRAILLDYEMPDETANAIMLYTDTRSMVRSPDGDTDFFEITSCVLQGDTLAPYLFITCLDYVLRRALDSNEELGFNLHIARSRRHSDVKITDANYAGDLAVLREHLTDATILLHLLEIATSEAGFNIN